MLTKPVVFDGDALGARGQFGWIGRSQGQASLIVFEDSGLDGGMWIMLEMEVVGYLFQNYAEGEKNTKSLRERDVLGFHGREGSLGLQLAPP